MKFVKECKKHKRIIIAAAAIISVFAIFFACNKYMCDKSVKKELSINRGLMKEELGDYVGDYIANTSVLEYISEEDMAFISKEISSGIINSMPQESLSDEEKEELRNFVLQTVQEQVALLNDDKEQVDGTIVTQDLLDYINNTVVPNMTAQLQLSGGEIDDLKANFDAISTEYDSDKESYDTLIGTLKDKIDSMENYGATNGDLEAMETDLSDLVNKKYGELEASTAEDLEAMETNLSDLVNKRYGELEASTAEGLAKVQAGLTEEAAARDAAINAVADLNTDITASVSALSDTLTADKAASEASDANLQNQIDALNSSFAAGLGGVTISYQDGHFYATAEDGTSKKLDYAE